MIGARIRVGAQWGDACILNVSSRGLLVQSGNAMARGNEVEIMRGDTRIVATVMWSAAGRCGLRSEGRLSVEDILSLEQSQSLQLVASNGIIHDRRRRPRNEPLDARLRGREMEFLAVGIIGISLAVGIWSMAETALASPLERVAAVLGG
jgi:hypothetical protein